MSPNLSSGYGGQSMVAPLRRVLVRRPDEAFGNAGPGVWHYTSHPDLAAAREEHDALIGLLAAAGAEVVEHAEPQPERADAIYVFDPALITDEGAVLLRMGKTLRRGEEEAIGRRLQELGIPILGALHGEATAEGGDLLWLDRQNLAAGHGFPPHPRGARQRRGAAPALGDPRSARRRSPSRRAALLRRPRGLPPPSLAHQPGGRRPC